MAPPDGTVEREARERLHVADRDWDAGARLIVVVNWFEALKARIK